MKISIHAIISRLMLFTATASAVIVSGGCHPLEEWDNNPQGNFEALWTILDEHLLLLLRKRCGLARDSRQICSSGKQPHDIKGAILRMRRHSFDELRGRRPHQPVGLVQYLILPQIGGAIILQNYSNDLSSNITSTSTSSPLPDSTTPYCLRT